MGKMTKHQAKKKKNSDKRQNNAFKPKIKRQNQTQRKKKLSPKLKPRMEHWLKPRPRKPQQITNKALQQSYTRTNKHNFGAETHIILQYESVHKTHHFAIYNLNTHTTSPIQPWGGWAGLSLLTHIHVIDFNLISNKNK